MLEKYEFAVVSWPTPRSRGQRGVNFRMLISLEIRSKKSSDFNAAIKGVFMAQDLIRIFNEFFHCLLSKLWKLT